MSPESAAGRRPALRRHHAAVPHPAPSTDALFLALRRMRAPLVAVVAVFTVAVTGLALKPVPAMRRSSSSSWAKPEPTPPMVKLGRTTNG